MESMGTAQKKELLKLLKDFYEVSGQRTAIFDKYNNVILEYPEHNAFCAEIRKSVVGTERCRECDLYGIARAKEQQNYVIYRCHANLLEVCAPIKDDCGITGYLMFGQKVLNKDYEEQRLKALKQCEDIISDSARREMLFDKVRTTSPNYLEASANILLTCASYINLKQLLKTNNNLLWNQIRDYIEIQAVDKFSLSEMAEHLHVSVATICNTAKVCSDKTIIQLVTERRINLAKKYLTNTDYSINEIAALVGIGDYNYFSRIFKQWTKKTPRQYRKNNS